MAGLESLANSNKGKNNRILADSANAKHRFGYETPRGALLGENAPKNSDLWFMEFTTVTNDGKNNLEQVGVLAKAVSPISIQTSSMPVDQYGKRVYIPTRVDFPEVNITMYDDIAGKMFDLCSGIYSKFFHNNQAEVTGANAEEVLTTVGLHGRKIPEGKHDYYHQHFEKITIYHFFGNLDVPGPTNSAANAGAGTLQKIDLINPLVTSMQFSGSDYSTTELRTVDFSVQPENVIIGRPDEIHFPLWMTLGMEYILDALSPLENNSKFQTYPPKGRRPDEMVDDRMTEEELVEQAKVREDQDNQDTQRKISQLMKLYNAKIKNPNEQGNEALESALEERVDVINAAQANKWTKQPTKTYVDDFNERGESDFRTTLKNPDVPSFGEIGSSNPPINKYTPFNTNLDDSMVQELVGSFFGKRDFNLGNVLNLKDTLRSVANNALLSTANSAFNSVANGLQIDGSSLIQSPTNPIKKPLMTGTTEKAFKIPTSETVNIINTGNHSGVSKVIKTWNGSGPE